MSENLTIPVTYGSTVLLPAEWPVWNAFQRDAVLLHEQSHVRRRDFYVHTLARLHRAVFWFSPLAWWLQSQLLELAEVASDDEAVRKVGDRVSYAAILIELAGKGSMSGFVGVAMARGRTVERRVERMLRETVLTGETSLFRRVLLVAAFIPCVGLSVGTWLVHAETAAVPPSLTLALLQQVASSSPQQAPAPAQQPAARAPQTVETTQYLSGWIEQEVPDIAVDEERNAFHSLKTDEEREQFIEAFWLRRDPTPNTLDNEFKDEYYRRIALANQRYGMKSGTPGWQTDRGRILIKFGEPDEIETHALGRTYYAGDGTRPFVPPFGDGTGPIVQTPPFERWRYRSITGFGNNVILEFVDAARDGNYRLEFDSPEKGIFFGTLKP